MPRKRHLHVDGAILRKLREEKNYSLAEFSELVLRTKKDAPPTSLEASGKAIDSSTISRIETGKNGTTRATAALLALVLGVTPEYLSGRPSDYEKSVISVPMAVVSQDKTKSDVKLIGPINDRVYVDLPRISVSARSAFADMCTTHIDYLTLETQRIYVQEPPAMYQDGIVFDVDGDSMEPLINSGDQVIAYRVPPEKWGSLRNCIIVISYNDTVTIKKIIENDLFSHKQLTLRPYRDELASFQVALRDINALFRVDEIYPRPKKARL